MNRPNRSLAERFLYPTGLLLALAFMSTTTSCHRNNRLTDAVPTFKNVTMKERHHLKNDGKLPILSVELSMPFPESYPDDSILKKLRRTMLTDFFPEKEDSVSQPGPAMEAYIRNKVKLYESSEDLIQDEDGTSDGRPGVAWWDKTDLLIRYNAAGLLSYTVESSQFSGGAHGGHVLRNTVIDLTDGEKLCEEDLFNEASLPLINDLILKKLEVQNKVESQEELEQIGYFDVSQIGQYKNFYLTEDGVVYTFNEYEIGAYALGTIEVKLDFKDLDGFFLPEGPLERMKRP